MDVTNLAHATILPADVGIAEELEFDKTNMITLLKKKNYIAHICVRKKSSISRPTFRFLNTGAGLNLVCTFFLPVRWCDHIHSILFMSFKSASSNAVNFRVKIMLFI